MYSSAQFWFIHGLLVSTGKFLFQRLEERTTSDSLSLSPLVLGMKRFLISVRGTRTTIHDWSFHGCHAYIHFPSFLEQFLSHLYNKSFHLYHFFLFLSWSGHFSPNILHSFLWRQFSFCSKFSCPLFHIILILRPNF